MVNLKKVLKAGVIAGFCGVGLCAIARKTNLTSRVANFAQTIEGVPFPGTRVYSFLASRQLRTLYAEVAEQILAETDYRRIVDIGTGAGYLPIEVGHRCSECFVVGIDESADLIRIANANARSLHAPKNVEFEVGNLRNLPFPGRYCDLAVSVNVLHHWNDPKGILDEIYHVLIPGGECWIYDYQRDVPGEIWDNFKEKLPFPLKIALNFGPIASSKIAYSEEDLAMLLEDTKFEHFEIEKLSLPLFGNTMSVFLRIKLRKSKR